MGITRAGITGAGVTTAAIATAGITTPKGSGGGGDTPAGRSSNVAWFDASDADTVTVTTNVDRWTSKDTSGTLYLDGTGGLDYPDTNGFSGEDSIYGSSQYIEYLRVGAGSSMANASDWGFMSDGSGMTVTLVAEHNSTIEAGILGVGYGGHCFSIYIGGNGSITASTSNPLASDAVSAAGTITANSPYVLTITSDSSGDGLVMYKNNVQIASKASPNWATSDPLDVLTLYVATTAAPSWGFRDGNLAEVIIDNVALEDSVREAEVTALMTKWNIS